MESRGISWQPHLSCPVNGYSFADMLSAMLVQKTFVPASYLGPRAVPTTKIQGVWCGTDHFVVHVPHHDHPSGECQTMKAQRPQPLYPDKEGNFFRLVHQRTVSAPNMRTKLFGSF